MEYTIKLNDNVVNAIIVVVFDILLLRVLLKAGEQLYTRWITKQVKKGRAAVFRPYKYGLFEHIFIRAYEQNITEQSTENSEQEIADEIADEDRCIGPTESCQSKTARYLLSAGWLFAIVAVSAVSFGINGDRVDIGCSPKTGFISRVGLEESVIDPISTKEELDNVLGLYKFLGDVQVKENEMSFFQPFRTGRHEYMKGYEDDSSEKKLNYHMSNSNSGDVLLMQNESDYNWNWTSQYFTYYASSYWEDSLVGGDNESHLMRVCVDPTTYPSDSIYAFRMIEGSNEHCVLLEMKESKVVLYRPDYVYVDEGNLEYPVGLSSKKFRAVNKDTALQLVSRLAEIDIINVASDTIAYGRSMAILESLGRPEDKVLFNSDVCVKTITRIKRYSFATVGLIGVIAVFSIVYLNYIRITTTKSIALVSRVGGLRGLVDVLYKEAIHEDDEKCNEQGTNMIAIRVAPIVEDISRLGVVTKSRNTMPADEADLKGR